MNIGYGSTLTNVNKINNCILEKKAISEYGKKRINSEIIFYQEIINKKINFPMPKLLSVLDNKFTMEYLNNYITYQQYLEKGGKLDKDRIFLDLQSLHQLEKTVSKDFFIENLKTETYLKVRERYKEISDIVEKYSYIKKVNNVEILNLDEILEFIKST